MGFSISVEGPARRLPPTASSGHAVSRWNSASTAPSGPSPSSTQGQRQQFDFANPGLSWAVGDVIPVKLIRSNIGPRVATAIPNQTAAALTAFSYEFPAGTFSDADSDALTYTATKSDGGMLPTWLSFNPTTRRFSGMPAVADVGTLTVKVTASDGTASISDEFNIGVQAAEFAHCRPLDAARTLVRQPNGGGM